MLKLALSHKFFHITQVFDSSLPILPDLRKLRVKGFLDAAMYNQELRHVEMESEEILRLRELQEQKGMDDATQKEHTKRIKELQKFIQSQPSEITEFDESLVKKLLEKVTVHDDYLEFRFKSGVTISIEM